MDINTTHNNDTSSTSLRDVFAIEKKTDQINIDALHIHSAGENTDTARIDFSAPMIHQVTQDPQLYYRKKVIRLSYRSIIMLWAATVVCGFYYYSDSLLYPLKYNNTVQEMSIRIYHMYHTILSYLQPSNLYQQRKGLSLVRSDAGALLTDFIQSSLFPLDKKMILYNALDELLVAYRKYTHHVSELQKNIGQYGFFPQELTDIFATNKVPVSLQRGLLALESIKLTTAIQVFSRLETFINEFATFTQRNPDEVRKQLRYIAENGIQDIYTFLSHCYMNPYEISYDCNVIGEFDTYYKTKVHSQLDTKFLKELIYYIDKKLEQTDTPNINIIFQKFDPREATITFSIQVNTFPQDEIALTKAGIVDPHIFIVTTIIHLLQQNAFVQGSAIQAKQIAIKPKTIKVGSTKITVNSSVLQYTLPLQKEMSTEIYDIQ